MAILLPLSEYLAGRWRALALPGLLAVGLAAGSCQNTTEAVPDLGRDYYPVAVGNYWVYAVRDTIWSAATQANPHSTPRDSSYQLRETITETFTDAVGQSAYRLVRAKRANATAAWVNDSVFTLSVLPSALVLNRGNARTVELIFPPREGRTWNFNAFNNNYNDTMKAETRQFTVVGKPFITGGGNSTIPAVAYPVTLTTANTNAASEASQLRRVSYQQVYAQGIGLVFRRRVNFAFLNYTDTSSPGFPQVFPPGAYTSGFTRRETLIDYHLEK